MRTGIVIEVSATDRARLEAVVADRNTLRCHSNGFAVGTFGSFAPRSTSGALGSSG